MAAAVFGDKTSRDPGCRWPSHGTSHLVRGLEHAMSTAEQMAAIIGMANLQHQDSSSSDNKRVLFAHKVQKLIMTRDGRVVNKGPYIEGALL